MGTVTSITYEKTAYDKIEFGLRNKINDSFQNVYVSPVFQMVGTESVRVNLDSVSFEEQHTNFSLKNYNVSVFYYTTGKQQMKIESQNKHIKSRIDKLEQQLLNSQYNSDGTDGANNKWINLQIEEIEFNVDSGDDDIYCTKFNLIIKNTNQY